MSELDRHESHTYARVSRPKPRADDAQETERHAVVTVGGLGTSRAASDGRARSSGASAFTPTTIPLDLSPLDPAQNGVLDALKRIERNTARKPLSGVATVNALPGAQSASGATAPDNPTTSVTAKVASKGRGASLRQQIYRVRRIERQVDRALPPTERDAADATGATTTQATPAVQTTSSPFERQRERVSRQKETETAVSAAIKKQPTTPPASDPQEGDGNKTATATPEKRLTADELRKLPLRGDGGKFLSREEKAGMSQAELAQAKSREAREKAKEGDKDRSLLSQMGDKLGEVAKGALDSKGDATDGVGTAVGNAYYSAAKEAYGAYQELAGEDSKARELYQWARGHWDKRREQSGDKGADSTTLERQHEATTQQASEAHTRQITSEREREKQAEAHRDETSEELEAIAEISEDGFEEVVKEIKRIDGGGGGLLPLRNPFRPGGGRTGGGSRTGGGAQRGRMGRVWDRVRNPFSRAPATAAASTAASTGTRATTNVAQAAPRAATASRLLGGTSRALGALAAPVTGALAYNSTQNELAERDDLTQAQKTTTAAATGIGAGGGALAGAATGAAAGAAVGSVVPVVGTAVGGILGGVVGGALGAWGGEKAGRSVGDAVASTMDNVEDEARNALDERESRLRNEEAKERKWYNPASWFSGGNEGGGPENTQASRRSNRGNRGGSTASPTPGGSASGGEREQALIHAMHDAGITDPNEQAAFMGQMHHESAGFSSFDESFNYSSAERIMEVSRTARNQGVGAVEAARAQGPEAVAELMYGGRMGNVEPGDGYKYRGRGFTQLTGRDNYTAASEALGIDLVSNPELAADPEVAAKVSTWYWQERGGLSEAAQRGDTGEVTRLINGGHNGLADREAQTNRYLAAAHAGELTVEPQQPAEQSGAAPVAIADNGAPRSPTRPAEAEADARPVTVAAAINEIAGTSTPAVEPILPSEPVTAIDDRQAAKAFHPAPVPASPARTAPATASATSAVNASNGGNSSSQSPRGGTSAPGVNDIQVSFSDPILTLMAMDRI